MSKKEGSILIVDDNPELLIAYEMFLSRHFQSVRTLNSPNGLPEALRDSKYDVLLLDMNFSAGIQTGNEGFFWMNKILETDPEMSIILITAYGDVDLAIRAIREGATDFVLKSWDKEKILSTILSAYQLRKSKVEIRNLKSKQKHLLDLENNESNLCRGSSQQMQIVMNTVSKVAPTDANILILGENGTGKEMLAKEIHYQSLRRDEIFMSIDMGTLTESLFESELFGHLKGAFTGATTDRPGRIEIASGGTLFLDEIGNLTLTQQAKLLSVIEKREVTRVGSNQPEPVDVRLVCATNANLYQLSEEGRFREDLLYRINSIQIELPPLRERPEDIPELLEHFTSRLGAKYNRTGLSISRHAMNQLVKHPWKGNIRELRNLVEKAILLSDGDELKPVDFATRKYGQETLPASDEFNLEKNEKKLITGALKRVGNNKKVAARMLGINRTTLYNKMKKYGIQSV